MTLSRSERDRMNAEAQLEQLVDAHGLEYVLELLASILLRQKADHIEQDDALAEWSRAGAAFSAALEQAAKVSARR